MLPVPNFGRTKEEGTDGTDLTDGIVSDQLIIWSDPKAVCWHGTHIAQIKLDLGEIQPIEEVAIRLQGGLAHRPDVFPDHIEVLVSDDGETFYLADDFDFWRMGDREQFGVLEEREVHRRSTTCASAI